MRQVVGNQSPPSHPSAETLFVICWRDAFARATFQYYRKHWGPVFNPFVTL